MTDGRVIMGPTPQSVSLPPPITLTPEGGAGGAFQNVKTEHNLSDLPVFQPPPPKAISREEAAARQISESSSNPALEAKVQNLESSLSRIEQLLVAFSLGCPAPAPAQSPASPAAQSPVQTPSIVQSPEPEPTPVPSPLVEVAPQYENTGPVVELAPLEEGQLRVHMPVPAPYRPDERLVQDWVAEVKRTIEKDATVHKDRTWKQYTAILAAQAIWSSDNWTPEMRAGVRQIFDSLIYDDEFVAGIVRGMMGIKPHVSLERIMKALASSAGAIAWAQYAVNMVNRGAK